LIFGVLRHHGGGIRGEPRPLAGVGVGAAIVDPRRHHLDRAGRGQHLPRLVGAVAHHQSPPVLVALADVAGDVGVDLGLQRLGQHPPGALAHELVDHSRAVAARVVLFSSRNYGEHGSYPSDRRWPAGLA